MLIVVAAPNALIVVAFVLKTANGLAVVTIAIALVVIPLGADNWLLIVVTPPILLPPPVLAPMLIVVPAPNALIVVAVVLYKENVVLDVATLVTIVGLVIVGLDANIKNPVPVAPVEVVPSIVTWPAIVVLPPLVPKFNDVAAPPMFNVVAVELNALTVVELDVKVLPVIVKLPADVTVRIAERAISVPV